MACAVWDKAFGDGRHGGRPGFWMFSSSKTEKRGKMTDKELKSLVRLLAGKGALAWRRFDDGSLLVINARGEKRGFKATICEDALKKIRAKNGKKKEKDE